MGRTLPIWNKFLKNAQFAANEPWLLRFFDQVRFYPVSEAELTQLRDDFREGRATIRIEETVFDFPQHLQFLRDNAADIADFQHPPGGSVRARKWSAGATDDDQAEAQRKACRRKRSPRMTTHCRCAPI